MLPQIEFLFVKDRPYESLANAIVFQAAEDYRTVLQVLSIRPYDKDFISEKESLLRFFRSEWYTYLTKLNPEVLIRNIEKEEYEDMKSISWSNYLK